MGCRENFTDHIEDCVVIECITYFLKFLKQTLKDATFNRVRRNEVEDQAVEQLTIAVNPTHPLFKAIRIPRNIIVKKNVAALEIDALACSLSGN